MNESMYFLLKMVIFQSVMLDFRGVCIFFNPFELVYDYLFKKHSGRLSCRLSPRRKLDCKADGESCSPRCCLGEGGVGVHKNPVV